MTQTKDEIIIYPLEGYAPPVGYALACLKKERQQTRATVAGLSVKDLDTHINGFLNSIGTLLYHIADIELDWLYVEILEQEIPKDLSALFPVYTRDNTGLLSVVAGFELTEHLERLAVVRKAVLEKLKDMDSEDFYRVRNLIDYDVNPAWVLYHLLEHEAKHGEQIARILRNIQTEVSLAPSS
jgi:uncharacterized damage-inducible protein DinB